MYDKAREARPKKLEKLRSAWAERAQNLRLQLRFWKKKYIIGRQGPRLSGERSGPGPSLGHHNRSRNPLKSSDSYYCIKIGLCFIIFKCHFQF